MIAISLKHMVLFVFATLFTLIHYAICKAFDFDGLDATIFLGVVFIVNLLCHVLQFAFCAMLYYKYCQALDSCCRWRMYWKLRDHSQAKRAMLRWRYPGISDQRVLTLDERHIAERLDNNSPRTPTTTFTTSSTPSNSPTSCRVDADFEMDAKL